MRAQTDWENFFQRPQTEFITQRWEHTAAEVDRRVRAVTLMALSSQASASRAMGRGS